jgi:hypothetical protein
VSSSATIRKAIQDFWGGLGFAAPHQWPESDWPPAWVWTEEDGGSARSGELPCNSRSERYQSRFRIRSTAEGWTQLGYDEAEDLRNTCIEALEDLAGVTFSDSVDGIDPVEYSKIVPVRVAGPAGEAAYWEWTIVMTVLTSR